MRVRCQNQWVRAAAVAACAALWPVAARGGAVVHDGTVGPAGSAFRSGADFSVPASMGRQVGANLFHSFSLFNLDAGESATFSGPTSVHNVVARVTGGSASNISGTLHCTIPDANFFLMNPAGVVFGPGAVLDVSGSFAVTTADVIKLADGGTFHATTPADSVLTTAAPVAFGFLGANPGAVTVAGSSATATILAVPPAKNLSIVSGPMQLQAAGLLSTTGRINLVAVGSAGDVTLDAADPRTAVTLGAGQQRAPISMTDSLLNPPPNAQPFPGGSSVIRASDLTLVRSRISSQSFGGVTALPADIDIDCSGVLSMTASAITARTADDSPGGAVRVRAATIRMGGDGTSGAAISTFPFNGAGHGGDVEVTADTLNITGGAAISAAVLGPGDGGDVHVTAGTLTIDAADAAPGSTTGIAALTVGSSGYGRGGNVRIDAGTMTLTNGVTVNTDALADAGGGNVSIHAVTLDVAGNSLISASTSGAGNAGKIDIVVDGAARLTNGGQLRSSTVGAGDAGSVTLQTADLTIQGQGTVPSGITAQAGADGVSGPFGRGGDVTVHAQSVSLNRGSGISIDTYGDKPGGSLLIEAPRVQLVDGGSISVSSLGAGSAGSISIAASDSLLLQNGGLISSRSLSSGNGGPITITAGNILIDRAGGPTTAINGQASAGGKGSDISLTARSLTVLNGANISVDTAGTGAGGNIALVASDGMRLSGFFQSGDTVTETFITASTLGLAPGGSVSLNAPQLELSDSAFVSVSTLGDMPAGSILVQAPGALHMLAGSKLASLATGAGSAGTVNIVAGDFLMSQTGLNDTSISGQSLAAGAGGVITVNVKSLRLLGGASIVADAASGGTGGSVMVTASGLVHIDGLQVDDTGLASPSRISVTTEGAGPGGSADVHADSVRLTHGGIINSSTGGDGNGGDISITAKKVVLSDRNAGIPSLLVSETDGDGPNAGKSGNIAIVADSLSLLRGAGISAVSSSAGDGGTVTVRAGKIRIDSQGFREDPSGRVLNFNTGIAARSEVVDGGGAGGQIRLFTDSLRMFDQAQLSAATATPDKVGGGIVITATKEVLLRDSSITARAAGDGGRIITDPPAVVLDNSIIDGRSRGLPVVVQIATDNFIASPDSRILTNTNQVFPSLDIAGTLFPIRAGLTQGSQLAPACGLRLQSDISSFIVTGRGGEPPAPGGWTPAWTLDLRPSDAVAR